MMKPPAHDLGTSTRSPRDRGAACAYVRGVLVAAMLWLASSCAQAQAAIVDSYQEAAGLTNLSVPCITQDGRGVLWICTENGLFRFDGFRINREMLPAEAGHRISSALADRAGHLWIATELGLYLRTDVDGIVRWQNIVRPDNWQLDIDEGKRMSLDDRGALFVMDQKNRLWESVPTNATPVLTAQRVALPPFAPYERTRDAVGGPLLVAGKAIWFGCGAGLCLSQDGKIKVWGPDRGLPAGPWSTLLLDRDGSLWARSSVHLAHLGRGDERFTVRDAPRSSKFSGTIAMVQDAEGAILTTADDDVARWDGRRWQQWTPSRGMPGIAIRALLFDSEGNLWLGTNGRGLHQWIGYGAVDQWTTSSGLPHSAVTAIARAVDGRLWAATADGIAWLDEVAGKFHPQRTTSARAGLVLSLGVDPAGALYWISDGKLLMLTSVDGPPLVISNDAHLGRIVQGAANLYLSQPDRTRQLGPGHSLVDLGSGRLPDGNFMGAVTTDGTREWFMTGFHLVRADKSGWVPMRDEHGTPSSISPISSFVAPSELWSADARGIQVYAVKDDIALPLRRIDMAAFGGAALKYIRVDLLRRVWVGTDQGMFIFEAGAWWHLDRTNGLLWNDLETGALLFDADGTVWVGTSAGATHVRVGLHQKVAPSLRLDALQFGAQTLSASPRSAVAWAGRRLRVTVGTSSIGSGRDTQLEFRLHDSEPWEKIEGNVIQLELPQPDAYAMEIRAAARFPIDRPGPTLRIAFELSSPWWQSTPARIAYIACAALLWCMSALGMRRRSTLMQRRLQGAVADRTRELEISHEAMHELGEYNVRSLELERERLSRELHDEMGQQLAALRMEVALARMRGKTSHPMDDGTLDTLLERVDRLVATVRTLVTELRPPALDGGLLTAIEWLATDSFRGLGVTYDLDLDPTARELPPDTATMVFRIVQESFTNVVRHAAAQRASVSLKPVSGQWELIVRDDGVGFDTAELQGRHGLRSMSERARAVDGTLTIQSARGLGTTIRLVIG